MPQIRVDTLRGHPGDTKPEPVRRPAGPHPDVPGAPDDAARVIAGGHGMEKRAIGGARSSER